MSEDRAPQQCAMIGRVVANEDVSSVLKVIELELPQPFSFEPGQFAMLNFPDCQFVFSRPFSILSAHGSRVRFLFRVVGRGTARLAAAAPDTSIAILGPLGNAFPSAQEGATVLVAGGCGLPPLHAWHRRYGKPSDFAYFGARDGTEVPWELLADRWRVSVDMPAGIPSGCEAATGLVVDCCRNELIRTERRITMLLACGPRPMLRAAVALAESNGWSCYVSVEEHMGCGYGVCRGCVIPAAPQGNLTACGDGPVLAAEMIDWERFDPMPARSTEGD